MITKGQDTDKIKLTIWMNMPSFYQIDLFRALVATGEVDLKVVFAKDLAPERRALGWHDDIDSELDVHFLSARNPIRDAMRLAWCQRDRIHVVNGIWAEPAFSAALFVLRFSCRDYFIYAEAPNPSHERGLRKKLLRWLLAISLAKTQRAGLLAVSHLSRQFFQGYGLRDERIYDFGYFRRCGLMQNKTKDTNKVEIVYVGQLIYRKRVDLLLDAVAPFVRDRHAMVVRLIGEGTERTSLGKKAMSLGLEDHIVFEGVVSSDLVSKYIVGADVLVLPSDFDGWGLVVNEALQVGTPVIVSDACGAAELIQQGRNGFVFRQGNALSLQKSLQSFLIANSETMRDNAAEMGQRITVDAAARYLVACVNHKRNPQLPKPIALWLQPLDTQPSKSPESY